MSFIFFVFIAVLGLSWSFYKDKGKTIESLNMSKGMLLSTAPQIGAILALIGLFLAILPEEAIQSMLGTGSLVAGGVYGAIIGTITILPAFVAFPLAASLLEQGAYLVSVAAFITTLTMVGFATAPVEIRYFGKRFTLIRNLASFIAALLIALGMVIIL